MTPTTNKTDWNDCQFLTCSVLPVRMACNLRCLFCFSKSSINTQESKSFRENNAIDWFHADIEGFYIYSKERGAKRLVITGGGEPLLQPKVVLHLIRLGQKHFDEITCFTNGSFLTSTLAKQLQEAGLSYLCYSRHAKEDLSCQRLMGTGVPTLERFFEAAQDLPVRATCVMAKGYVDSTEKVWDYIHALSVYNVREFTFKHTYVAYQHSVYQGSKEDRWAALHQVEFDPFAAQGTELFALPWGPKVRKIGDFQVCYYQEPTPTWEKTNKLCRSSNLLSNGKVYASLEEQESLLFQLTSSNKHFQVKR